MVVITGEELKASSIVPDVEKVQTNGLGRSTATEFGDCLPPGQGRFGVRREPWYDAEVRKMNKKTSGAVRVLAVGRGTNTPAVVVRRRLRTR